MNRNLCTQVTEPPPVQVHLLPSCLFRIGHCRLPRVSQISNSEGVLKEVKPHLEAHTLCSRCATKLFKLLRGDTQWYRSPEFCTSADLRLCKGLEQRQHAPRRDTQLSQVPPDRDKITAAAQGSRTAIDDRIGVRQFKDPSFILLIFS